MAAEKSSIYQFRALEWLERELAKESVSGAQTRAVTDIRGKPDPRDAVATNQADTALKVPQDFLDHLREHWLSGEYWGSVPADQVQQRLAEGFLAAIDEARLANLPVIPIWVRSTEDAGSDDFRVDHVKTPTAVVVAIITPKPNFGGGSSAA